MIVVVGPIGAGKTSLIQAICYGVLLGSEATLSCCLYEFGALKIWDTPGDDKYSWQAETAVRRATTVVYCVPEGEAHTRDYSELNEDARVLKVFTKADRVATREGDGTHTSAVTREGLETLKELLREDEPQTTPESVNLRVTREKQKHCC